MIIGPLEILVCLVWIPLSVRAAADAARRSSAELRESGSAWSGVVGVGAFLLALTALLGLMMALWLRLFSY